MNKPNFRTKLSRVTPISMNFASLFLEGSFSESLMPAHCQRKYCWTTEQYQSFVQYVVDSYTAGEFITLEVASQDDFFILDGQHRIKAIKDFLNDHFPIKDVDTCKEWYYSKIVEVDNSFTKVFGHMLMCSWRRIQLESYDKELVQKIYNNYNYAGMRH